MKQWQAETYSVAWFKLADCIARGEKERALGIYRLLSHSFDDPALTRQLHADILCSFHDERAQEVYQEAAHLYRERNRLIEAAAVYEHLITLDERNVAYRIQLIELYQQLRIASKVTEYIFVLIDDLMARNEWKRAIELSEQYETAGDLGFTAQLHEKIFFHLIDKEGPSDTIMLHARKAIDAWYELENQQAINRMLASVKTVDEKVWGQVREYADR